MVIPDSVVQWSAPWLIFLWCPIKVLLVCGFSVSLCIINSNNPSSYLFASPGPTSYDKATTFVYSLALRSLDSHKIPTHKHISAKKVFLKLIPMFLMLYIIIQIIYQYPGVRQYKEHWKWHNFWDFLSIKTFTRKSFIIL